MCTSIVTRETAERGKERRDMKKSRAIPILAMLVFLFSFVCGAQAGSKCPLVVSLSDVKMEIVDVDFTDQVDEWELSEEMLEDYRLAVVTVRVEKAKGQSLTLAAADLTLHYFYGSDEEVAPCEGLSNFTKVEDVDRSMELPSTAGPGWVKQTTGTKSTESSVVYFDAVFSGIEPNTSKLWICLAQPTQTKPFETDGW
jgi:hypothetical protein